MYLMEQYLLFLLVIYYVIDWAEITAGHHNCFPKGDIRVQDMGLQENNTYLLYI